MKTGKARREQQRQSVAETANYFAGVITTNPQRNLSIVTRISMVVLVSIFGVASIGEIDGGKVEETGFICMSQSLMKHIFEMPE